VTRAEYIVAKKRIEKWPKEHRKLMELPRNEVEIVVLLVALLDARPCGEEQR
jgi:hypothetical protein